MILLVVLGQHIAMRFDQLIDKRPDLVETELCRRMRIQHGGMIDMLALASQCCFHDQ